MMGLSIAARRHSAAAAAGAALLLLAAPAPARGPAQRTGEVACSQAKPLPAPSYDSFFVSQRAVSDKSAGWKLTLSKWSRLGSPVMQFTFRVLNRSTHSASHFTLTSNGSTFFAAQIDEADLVGRGRALLLTRAASSISGAYLVRLPGGGIVDHFLCFRPTISPGHRFLAFIKAFPEHPGPVSVSEEYLVYDLTRGPDYNRPRFEPGVTYDAGWPIYPPGATNAAGENLVADLNAPVHLPASNRLFWLDKDNIAFADAFEGTVSLVVADLAGGIRHPAVSVTSLMGLGVLNRPKCSNLSPAAFFVKDISRIKGNPSRLCLLFRTWEPACLARRSAVVELSKAAGPTEAASH